jgi:hypothetical protein
LDLTARKAAAKSTGEKLAANVPRRFTVERGITMKHPHNISFWHTNGELLSGNDFSRVVLSSGGTNWNDIVVEQHDFSTVELAEVMFKRHVVAINIGHYTTWKFKNEEPCRRFFQVRGPITFFPSHQPFSGGMTLERGVFVHILFLALDPVFVSSVAEGLELDPNRIKLDQHRRIADPTLHHIAMALRAGVRSGAALDRMYGEALSTALAVHLLREYARQLWNRKDSTAGYRVKSWCGPWNIFTINWTQI